jgi:hypothetical protein
MKTNSSTKLVVMSLLVGLMAIASAQTPDAAPPTVTFSSQTHTTGPNPSGVVSGDFDNDGRPDLAVIDSQANHVAFLLGAPGGNFNLGTDVNTGVEPVQIVTGTFTRSGKQDLAVANAGSKTLTILLGHGNATFSTESVALTGVPMALIAANLLNNGLTQLAVVECASANTAPCSLNLYQSTTSAVFHRSQSIALPGAPLANGLIASDDFNLDNKPDIAVATLTQVLIFTDSSSFNGTGSATVKLNSKITPPNTSSIVALAAGHFNAGAGPDLALESFNNVADTNFPTTDYVYLNTGTGSFFLKSTMPGNNFGHSIQAVDIDNDGTQDLIFSGLSIKDPSLFYVLGNGDGTFFTKVSIGSSGPSTGAIVRDMNLDARHDIVETERDPIIDLATTEILLNQNALQNCPPPGSGTLAVKLCSTLVGGNILRLSASGDSPNGVKRVELWIDGTKRSQAFGDQLNTQVTVSSGTHRVTVVGVDLYDALVKKAMTLSVP